MKILGFDLGDGESAVTLLDEDSTVEPRVMPLCGKNSLISAVGVKDGRIVIGEAASVTDGAAEAKVRFKSRYLTDPAASADVRAFAQGVMNELVRTQPALMAEVSRTVVGCPAGWGDGRREQYAALLESAGFPNVSVVPEPRAAFLYARHARGLRVSPELMKKSAMVIDVGSSTTDFAYIVDGHQQNVSLFGDTNLGGGLIDERILAHALAASKDGKALRAVFAESPAWRSYCELEARRLKESYFLDEEKLADAPLTRTLTVCYDEPLALELSIGGASIRGMVEEPIAALGGRSFVGCLQDALRAAVEVSRECPPEVVILTGGASRMAFFQQACREAFADALARGSNGSCASITSRRARTCSPTSPPASRRGCPKEWNFMRSDSTRRPPPTPSGSPTTTTNGAGCRPRNLCPTGLRRHKSDSDEKTVSGRCLRTDL